MQEADPDDPPPPHLPLHRQPGRERKHDSQPPPPPPPPLPPPEPHKPAYHRAASTHYTRRRFTNLQVLSPQHHAGNTSSSAHIRDCNPRTVITSVNLHHLSWTAKTETVQTSPRVSPTSNLPPPRPAQSSPEPSRPLHPDSSLPDTAAIATPAPPITPSAVTPIYRGSSYTYMVYFPVTTRQNTTHKATVTISTHRPLHCTSMSKRSLPQVIHPISITRTSTHAHALLPNSHTPTSELSRNAHTIKANKKPGLCAAGATGQGDEGKK
ncbi:MAGE-like protein 2 [Portunus trituberculatus]|uniref:MAGE-like protein 2 n=1 Tax=Portunus trituberculatus TaxID=210409 RepID=UPI001E1CE6F2|nr:MAGE-like protein 2 [Portunus trituberculatus]